MASCFKSRPKPIRIGLPKILYLISDNFSSSYTIENVGDFFV